MKKLIAVSTLTFMMNAFNALAEPFVKQRFASQSDALFYIFLMVFWIIFLILTYTMTGKTGRVIGLFNLLQMVAGLIFGTVLTAFSTLLGIMIVMTAVGTFVGLSVYGR